MSSREGIKTRGCYFNHGLPLIIRMGTEDYWLMILIQWHKLTSN